MDGMHSYFKNLIIPADKIFKSEVLNEISNKVFAHTIDGRKPEMLWEHSNLTLKFFSKYINDLSLFSLINKMIDKIYSQLNIKEYKKDEFREILWTIIVNLVYYHDIGKINIKYQKKLKNTNNFLYLVEFGDSNHSKYSKYLLDYLFFSELQEKTCVELDKDDLEPFFKIFYMALVLSSIVDRHHSNLDNINELLSNRAKELKNDDTKILEHFFSNETLSQFCNTINSTTDSMSNGDIDTKIHDKTTMFYLYKLVCSLLITSDYYATYCYKERLNIDDIEFNIFNEELIETITNNFYKNKEYNKKLLNNDIVNMLRSKKPEEIHSLNELRSKIIIEASDRLMKYLEQSDNKRIFFLNVPTGGGKTNISMKLLIDILSHPKTGDIKRAYYVFPYINIIEQNYKSLITTLTTSENKDIVSKIYSYNEWDFSLEDRHEELEYYINQQFLNNPINVISNVNFFNTFIKNGKKINYKLLNLANSIVILDEIQTLPNDKWEYFSKLIKDISENYNIYFILMSATLPDLSKFLSDREREMVFNTLIDNPDIYQQHDCFKRTVVIEKINLDTDHLIDEILSEKSNYSNTKIKVLCVVNTIENSYLLFKELEKNLPSNFDVYLLNSTILPHRRQMIIDIFNKDTRELEKDIVLVSTQSVEAGVDIDCHFGFREIAPIDSIEQICGRINRENKRKPHESKLYIFDWDTACKVYKEDMRLIVQKQLGYDDLVDYINNKKFNDFYDRVISNLKFKENNYSSIYNELIKPTKELYFFKLAKQNYIKDDNITLFVPIDLDINEALLSDGEIKYLENMGIDCSKTISGDDIWRLFKEINTVKTHKNNYFLEIKKFQSILNRFTFSITNRWLEGGESLRNCIKDDINNKKFDESGGIVKVNQEFIKSVGYSIENGLNPRKLDEYYNRTFYII